MICLTSATGISEAEEIENIIAEISRGDSSAMARLYESTKDAVFGYALSILKNSHDAEDVLHDCFVSIYYASAEYRPLGKPMAWIFTIVRNLCLGKIRNQKRFSDLPEEDWKLYIESNKAINVENKVVLEICTGKLSQEEREILILHAVSGIKHREIAALLGLPVATVLSKYHRTLKKLRAFLDEGDGKIE